MAAAPPEIFDRRLRRLRRDRAAAHFNAHAFVVDAIGDEIVDRLADVSRSFSDILDLGCHDGRLGRRLAREGARVTFTDAGPRFAALAGGVVCDEDRLPFADASFDLVVSAGVLDQVNDLPGALSLVRRVLKPDGLFLAGFAGAGSLARLKAALLAGDEAALGGAVPRIHPQIDVRAAGDLLQRAGFALPVADGLRLEVRYPDPLRLMRDLRGMAAANLLATRAPLRRAALAAAIERFAAAADPDGRTPERFELVFLTGWSPGPDQPQPARRGSGTASLAEALRPPT